MALTWPCTPGKNLAVLVSDGRHVVACEAQGATRVMRRRTGELSAYFMNEWAEEAWIEDEVVFLVGGRVDTLRAISLRRDAPAPCPSTTGVQALRSWTDPATASARGLVSGHVDGLLRTWDAQHRPIGEMGRTDVLETFDVHGVVVAAAYARSPLCTYDCRTGQELHRATEVPADLVTSVHLDEAGAVVASLDGSVRAYDPELRSVRTTHVRSHVGRLVADPRDPHVVHAVTPTEILRLDRATLEVLERTPGLSAHLAFSVDALGRLLGVEGGIEVLDPIPPRDPAWPDVEASYDLDAFFDKDLPGMVANHVEIWQHGPRVVVRTWPKEAEARAGDVTAREGAIARVVGDVVHLAMDDGTEARFDRTSRQLVK